MPSSGPRSWQPDCPDPGPSGCLMRASLAPRSCGMFLHPCHGGAGRPCRPVPGELSPVGRARPVWPEVRPAHTATGVCGVRMAPRAVVGSSWHSLGAREGQGAPVGPDARTMPPRPGVGHLTSPLLSDGDRPRAPGVGPGDGGVTSTVTVTVQAVFSKIRMKRGVEVPQTRKRSRVD